MRCTPIAANASLLRALEPTSAAPHVLYDPHPLLNPVVTRRAAEPAQALAHNV